MWTDHSSLTSKIIRKVMRVIICFSISFKGSDFTQSILKVIPSSFSFLSYLLTKNKERKKNKTNKN